MGVEVPKKVACKDILFSRPVGDFFFNNSFIVFEEIENSIRRKIKQHEFLNKKDFPTLNLRMDLLNMFPNYPIYEDVLITNWVEGTNVAEFIKTSTSEEIKLYLQETAQLTKRTHSYNIIWADANIQNTRKTEEGIMIPRWELKSNPYKTAVSDK